MLTDQCSRRNLRTEAVSASETLCSSEQAVIPPHSPLDPKLYINIKRRKVAPSIPDEVIRFCNLLNAEYQESFGE
jgi:hypothetical protein